jgi:hypothetical protein
VDDDDYAGFDTSSDDDDTTIPCPHCGAEIYDDAERCPECGEYLSHENAPTTSNKPWWIVIGVLFCLAIVILWAIAG